MIINIRGTSGSGKSTLVHNLLAEFPKKAIYRQLGDWKKAKIVAYEVTIPDAVWPTYVIGRYETQCGGCDAMSYKGSHNDIEALVREFAAQGNVVFEGLTISSTLTRWKKVDDDFPHRYIWMFMETPEEECLRRILSRNGGRMPKVDSRGLADYQRKYRGCAKHIPELSYEGRRVAEIHSDEEGYKRFKKYLDYDPVEMRG